MEINELKKWCDENDYIIKLAFSDNVYRLEHEYSEFITQIIYVNIETNKIANKYIKREGNLFFIDDDIHDLYIPLNNVKRDAEELIKYAK